MKPPKLTKLEVELLDIFFKYGSGGIVKLDGTGTDFCGLEEKGLIQQAPLPFQMGVAAGHKREVWVAAEGGAGLGFNRFVITEDGRAAVARRALLGK